MAPYINIDGRLLAAATAAIPHDNRAFRYGHGLFETMLFEDGTIALESPHWQRLFAGMSQLYFEVPKHFTGESLAAQVRRTVHKNKLDALCRVRLQVWPGSGGLYDASTYAPHYIIECFPLQKELTQLNGNGLVVGIATGLAKSGDSLSHLKSCNALIYSIAARQAKKSGWNDALILNTEGRVIESTIANIFWVKGAEIFTPPLAEGCIGGVMRQQLLHLLPTKGIPVSEQVLSIEDLMLADELLLTNAIRKVKWVNRLGEKNFRQDFAKKLAQWL